MNGDLKQTFVLQCVQEYFGDVEDGMALALIRTKSNKTKSLSNSISSRSYISGKGAAGSLIFKDYGRFVDMGVGRAHPLGGLKATTLNLQSRSGGGAALVKDKTRRPKKFYSKVAYGNLNYLINKILYGFSEDAVRSFQQIGSRTGP